MFPPAISNPLSRTSEQLSLSARIRELRREVAAIDSKKQGLAEARQSRMNTLARLEAQLANCESGSVRSVAFCS